MVISKKYIHSNAISQLQVWRKYAAQKDDVYILDKQMRVIKYYKKPMSDLTNAEKRLTIKTAIIDAVEGRNAPCSQ